MMTVGATCDPHGYTGRIIGLMVGTEVELAWSIHSIDGRELRGVGHLTGTAITPVRRTGTDTWVYKTTAVGEVPVGNEQALMEGLEPSQIDGIKIKEKGGVLAVYPTAGTTRVPCAGPDLVTVEGCDATWADGGWKVTTPCEARITVGSVSETVAL
jgi:hypothetical protein